MLHIPNDTLARLRAERDRPALPSGIILDMLKGVGLRPTRQRRALGALLFRDGHRHITVDDLHQDAIDAGVPLSLATVYNTLNQFAEAGLIRRVSLHGGRTYFDTDAGDHQHFYVEAEDRIIDIAPGEIRFGQLPTAPSGYEITTVDVVIRLARIEAKPDSGCRGPTKPGCAMCGACTSIHGEQP